MAVLRTHDEIWIQGSIDALDDPPMSQAKADQIAAILAPHWSKITANRRPLGPPAEQMR